MRLVSIFAGIVFILSCYVIIAPLLPEVVFQVQEKVPVLAAKSQDFMLPLPSRETFQNMLIIPKIGVNAPILEGSENSMNKGIWHIPFSGDPQIGSNMVLAGHRFLYLSGENTLYHLPKLIPGDAIYILWNGTRYAYTVMQTKTVKPQDISIEEPTSSPQLTVYTCTPLWTAKYRFIVIAKPI